MEKFKLNQEFVDDYSTKQPNWGFNGLGYFIYKKTYARNIYNEKNEVLRTE